jgi:hypothetical protein
MVHDIPCFDLPPLPKETTYPEASLMERVRWNRTLKAGKKLNISLPLELLTADDNERNNTTPTESPGNDANIGYKFVNHGKRPSLRLEVLTLRAHHIVRDASATTDSSTQPQKAHNSTPTIHCRFCPCDLPSDGKLCEHLERCGCGIVQFSTSGIVATKMSTSHPTDADFSYCCPASTHLISPTSFVSTPTSMLGPSNTPIDFEFSPASPRKKFRYPSMKKIPEDLPCHERYAPISRSRSTRVIASQKTWSPKFSAGEERWKDDNGASVESDASSVYSQDDHIDSPSVRTYRHE